MQRLYSAAPPGGSDGTRQASRIHSEPGDFALGGRSYWNRLNILHLRDCSLLPCSSPCMGPPKACRLCVYFQATQGLSAQWALHLFVSHVYGKCAFSAHVMRADAMSPRHRYGVFKWRQYSVTNTTLRWTKKSHHNGNNSNKTKVNKQANKGKQASTRSSPSLRPSTIYNLLGCISSLKACNWSQVFCQHFATPQVFGSNYEKWISSFVGGPLALKLITLAPFIH